MSTTTCPTCSKVVDPLRARSVGVRDGKVVAYCSAACAAAGESRPVSVRVRTPAVGVAVVIPTSADSGPIIEIIREGSVPTARTPASGVPVATAAAATSGGTSSSPPNAGNASHAGNPGNPNKKKNKGKRGSETPAAGVVVAPASAPKSGPTTLGAPTAKTGGELEADKALRPRRDHTPTPVELAKRKQELASAEEADDDAMINGDDAPAPRKLPVLLIAVIVLVVGGGVVLAIKMMSKSGTAHAASMPEPVTAPRLVEVAAPAPTPAPPTTAAMLAQARSVLAVQLASGSPRVQRRAAEALARTGDPDARAALTTALAAEPSDIARVDIAYALARGGDARGTTALLAALASTQRRDVRAEAANQLARLGDARAAPVLADYLDVSQLRVGAAEHLAYLAESRALKVLAALRADPRTSVDDRARAVIALGIAGDASVTPDLRALLTDPRFNAYAAAALAALHDPAARPVLAEHLAIPSLRTDAARALRRLEPELDPAPLLPPLAAALTSPKDTDAVQAAEAVLLLAGPASWSQYE